MAELIAEQRTKGSNKEAGWTDFKYDWKWNTNSSEGKFNVTNTGVAITITMRMPRWEDEDQAKKCLQQNWDKSSANLLKHENMHITLAEGLEKQIEKAIIDVPAQASDAELTVAVNAAANSTIQKNKIIQMKFDRDTNHGEKRSKIPNRVEGLQMKRNPKASAWQILP